VCGTARSTATEYEPYAWPFRVRYSGSQ